LALFPSSPFAFFASFALGLPLAVLASFASLAPFLPFVSLASSVFALGFASPGVAGAGVAVAGAGTMKAITFCRTIATTGHSADAPTLAGKIARSALRSAIACALCAVTSLLGAGTVHHINRVVSHRRETPSFSPSPANWERC
jgi:hypothetical protein